MKTSLKKKDKFGYVETICRTLKSAHDFPLRLWPLVPSYFLKLLSRSMPLHRHDRLTLHISKTGLLPLAILRTGRWPVTHFRNLPTASNHFTNWPISGFGRCIFMKTLFSVPSVMHTNLIMFEVV